MIDGQCAEVPMTMTFQTALKIYRTAVQNQFPQGPDTRTARRGVAQVKQGVTTVVDQNRAKVKGTNLNTLRAVLSAGKTGNFTNKTFQTLPRPLALGCMLIGGGYALHKLIPGPVAQAIESNFTVTRNGNPLSLGTYHFVHTDILSVAVNLFVLTTFGRYHFVKMGATSFLTLAGVGAVAGSLATGKAVSQDPTYRAAGGCAISGAVLTYHAFKSPVLFNSIKYARFLPLGWVGLAALYGIKYNDQGLVAGVAAGYLTFALGLL